ncbi:MAG: hypothetical protein GXC94_11655 [Comamonadaceae bacterium]|jgi:hypothetical protein|nr:hypothetical protein [Comamonadaceae bacterium]
MNNGFGRRLAGALVSACLGAAMLTACGGGGGSASGPTTQPAEPSSGLLPAASAVGALLAEDASAWRPLIDKAVYRYRGRQSVSGGTQRDSFYDNVVTQLAQGGGVVENASNAYNEGPDTDSPPVRLQAGTISQQLPLLLAPGAALTLEFVELRSPLRSNDRYVIADRRVADIGSDVDGDKKNDGMDLAIWVQVVGEEVIDLPYRKGVRAIRTDATIRMRLVPSSSSSTVSEAVDARLSVWYAAGLGPVRVRRDIPHPNVPSLRQVDEQTLVAYETATTGLGSSAAAQMLRSASGSAIPLANDAVAFDNHVVTFSSLPNTPSALGFTLTQIDVRGALMASTAYPAEMLAERAYNGRLLRLGDELRLVYVGGDGISMLRFSGDGRSLLSKTPTLLVPRPLGSVPYAASPSAPFLAASSQNTLWLVTQPYIDSAGLDSARLELRRFNADGNPVGMVQVLESGATAYGVRSVNLAASGRQLFLTWYRGLPAAGPRHLVVDAATGQTLPDAAPPGTSDLGDACQTQGMPLLRDAANLLACGYGAERLVTLGSDGLALRTAAGAVRDTNPLPPEWITSQGGLSWVSDAQRLGFYGRRYAKFWPEDNLESSFIQFGEVVLGSTGPDASSYRTLARIEHRILQPQYAFSFGNRILVIGTDCWCQGGNLGTLTVWR